MEEKQEIVSDISINSPIGLGFVRKGKKYVTHTRLPLSESAFQTLVLWQKVLLVGVCLSFLMGIIINIKLSIISVIAFLTFLYSQDLIFSLYILLRSLNNPPEIKFSQKTISKIDEQTLPIYSILCPLYKEAKVLPQFVGAIKELDWPKDKLDVLLLLEEDDHETINCAYELNLPPFFKILVVPDSLPKTKPKACNYGLANAVGEYVVVYDAEDKPDPLQLKKAHLAFQKLPNNVVCLQSKLNYYNANQNLLTRLFTSEYSLWFDVILPGFQSINTIIPLGGTSNHFKKNFLTKLNGWDPFNVTEDCDLGVRIFKKGYKTAIIDSTTYEEANSKIKSWIRQRSRWLKGYIQTYLVHTRDPIGFVRSHGIHALIFHLIIGIRTIFILINPLLWVTTLSYFLFNSYLGPTIEALYPVPIYYVAVSCLVFGNFMYFYIYMIGCAKRKRWELVKYVFFVPAYWVFASISAVIAFQQLVVKPHFWEKTEHGFHLSKARIGYPLKIDWRFIFQSFQLVNKVYFVFSRTLSDLLGLLEEIKIDNSVENGNLRILVFNWRDTKHVWNGGAEVYIHELARRWVAVGYKVTFFCGWDRLARRNETVDGIRVIRRGGFYTVYPLAILYYLFKLRGKFDIVVDCENGIPFFTPLFVEVPKILLIHHVHQEVFRKHLPFPLSKIAIAMESKLMPNVYKNQPVITISNSSKADLVDRGWVNPEKIEVISPGVDLTLYKKTPKTSFPSFIYLGRLMAWKNLDTLLYAFSDLIDKVPVAELTIAGFGEDLVRLQKIAQKLGIEKKVHFPGRVTEEERSRLFGVSWAAIQPSSFEGWGITVIEANACGTPVIASDVNGLRDSVLDGRTGLLFPARNAKVLSQKMLILATNQRFRSYLSDEAFFWARCFNWDHSAKTFERVIVDYLGRRQVIPSYQYVRNSVKE